MRAETKAKYPYNWKRISRWTIDARGNKCEECARAPELDGVVLTVHHIDYDPGNNDLSNLVVLCQGCHLRRQAQELKQASRYANLEKLMRMGQLCFQGLEPPEAKNWKQALQLRRKPTQAKRGSHARRDTEL